MFRNRDKKLERIAAVDLFRRCDKRHIEQIGSIADEIDVPAGEVLFRQGQTGRILYVVESGEISVDIDGEEVAVVGPGETVGEMGLLNQAPRIATCTAKTASEVYAISAEHFMPMLENNPTVAIALLEDISERIRDVEQDRQRLARQH